MEYLNIITAFYRESNFHQIYESIPEHNDIHWIVVKSHSINTPRFDNKFFKDNVTIESMDIQESWATTYLKVNRAIELIRPGFATFLDDDTTFNLNAYDVFKKHGQNSKFIMGKQATKFGYERPATIPTRCVTDGAQAIIHKSLFDGVLFEPHTESRTADTDYLLKMWEKAKPEERLIWDVVVSNYNFLS
jgi:hypothetical protein